jgi:hypothetical protein
VVQDPRETVGQHAGGGRALGGILGQGGEHELLQAPWQALALGVAVERHHRRLHVRHEPLERVFEEGVAHLGDGLVGEQRGAAHEQVVEHHAQAVHVARRGELAGLDLLGLRVVGRADEHVPGGRVGADGGRVVPRAREPEVV